MLSEIYELNQYRLARDLSYDQLAQTIGLTGPALYRILTQPNPQMRDRTRYKIEQFLAKLRKRGATA